MMIITLLLSTLSIASTPLWDIPMGRAEPRAAFFEPTTESIYISLQSDEAAGIAKVSLDGKIVNRSFAVARGEAGPLRAFDGNLYWVGGEKVWKVPLKGGKKIALQDAPLDPVSDLAVDKDGTVYLATKKGINDGAISKKSVTALFILDRTLYFLEEGNLREYSLQDKKLSAVKTKFCKNCSGLERSSAGDWLTVENGKLMQWKAKKKIPNILAQGRIAYIFQMDTKNDFLVIPQKNSVHAERFPEEKSKL